MIVSQLLKIGHTRYAITYVGALASNNVYHISISKLLPILYIKIHILLFGIDSVKHVLIFFIILNILTKETKRKIM